MSEIDQWDLKADGGGPFLRRDNARGLSVIIRRSYGGEGRWVVMRPAGYARHFHPYCWAATLEEALAAAAGLLKGEVR